MRALHARHVYKPSIHHLGSGPVRQVLQLLSMWVTCIVENYMTLMIFGWYGLFPHPMRNMDLHHIVSDTAKSMVHNSTVHYLYYNDVIYPKERHNIYNVSMPQTQFQWSEYFWCASFSILNTFDFYHSQTPADVILTHRYKSIVQNLKWKLNLRFLLITYRQKAAARNFTIMFKHILSLSLS